MVVPWVHAQYLLHIGPNIKSIVKGLMAKCVQSMCTTSVLSIIVCVLRDMGRGLVRLGRALWWLMTLNDPDKNNMKIHWHCNHYERISHLSLLTAKRRGGRWSSLSFLLLLNIEQFREEVPLNSRTLGNQIRAVDQNNNVSNIFGFHVRSLKD